MGLSSKQVSADIHYWPQGGLDFPKPDEPNEKQNATLLKCPRCESTNTKFCYYNNYNRSQPRHFCRACRRHWTDGGALRNIPIGGGRKNKRRKIAAPSLPAAFGENPAAIVIGEMKVPIFPNILQQARIHPPPESSAGAAMESLFGASFSNSAQTFMEDFSSGLSGEKIPSACSSSSHYRWRGIEDFGGGCEEGVLGMMEGSKRSGWEMQFPASYWDFLDGGGDEFINGDAVVEETVVP